jgi:hypothetical protein
VVHTRPSDTLLFFYPKPRSVKWTVSCGNGSQSLRLRLQDAEREIHITKAPPYIVIDLKRFRHDGRQADMMQRMMGGRKLNTLIDFPLDGLDMAEFMATESAMPVPAACPPYGSPDFGRTVNWMHLLSLVAAAV